MEQKEEINIQAEQDEETRILKNGERLRNLWDNFKGSSIQIIEVPEGEEKEEEIENLIERIMKEIFPSLAKELDMLIFHLYMLAYSSSERLHNEVLCRKCRLSTGK